MRAAFNSPGWNDPYDGHTAVLASTWTGRDETRRPPAPARLPHQSLFSPGYRGAFEPPSTHSATWTGAEGTHAWFVPVRVHRRIVLTLRSHIAQLKYDLHSARRLIARFEDGSTQNSARRVLMLESQLAQKSTELDAAMKRLVRGAEMFYHRPVVVYGGLDPYNFVIEP